jgi:quinol monooxygenase YgiN
MINVHIKMTVIPEKRRELLQTIQAISDLTRKESGCLYHALYQDVEDEKKLRLIESWKTPKQLEKRLKSNAFLAFLGAVNFMSKKHEIKFFNLKESKEMQAMFSKLYH